MNSNLTVNGVEYPLFVHKEERDNSTANTGKSGIHIRVPYNLQREELFKQILKMKKWAEEEIKAKPPEFKRKGWKRYQHGDTITVGKDTYLLHIEKAEKESSSAHLQGNTFFSCISDKIPEEKRREHISVLLSRVIGRQKLPYLTQKIHQLNNTHFNFKFKKIFLKYNLSNWGSCSGKGNINISTRSLFAPDDVLDSICIHELAHLQEHNHSPAFWELVKKAMPDYDEKKKWLKEHGEECWF